SLPDSTVTQSMLHRNIDFLAEKNGATAICYTSQARRPSQRDFRPRCLRQTQFAMTTVFGGHLDFVGIPAEPAKSSGLPPAARRIKAYARRCSPPSTPGCCFA